MNRQRRVVNRLRLWLAAAALILGAAACGGGSVTIASTNGDAPPNSDRAGTVGTTPPGEDAPGPAADTGAQAGAIAAPGQALLPADLCRGGEVIAGVVDLAYANSVGAAEVGAELFGDPFEPGGWSDFAAHDCTVASSLSNLSVSIGHGDLGRVATLESSFFVGEDEVEILSNDATVYAQVRYDDPASANGVAALVITYRSDVDTDGRAIVTALAERIVPNVTYAPPGIEEVVLTDPYDIWREESKVQWLQDCNDGDLFACDFLWFTSSSGSEELTVALTCGGIRELTANFRCVDDEREPITEGDHPLLDQFTTECRAGDVLSCRKLGTLVSGSSAYWDFAEACRDELEESPGQCTVVMQERGF